MSPDPVETNPNNGASFNRYWYANNNPYKFTDPDGRESACFSTGIGCGLTPMTPEYRARQEKAMTGLIVAVVAAPVVWYLGATAFVVAADSAAVGVSGSIAMNGPAIVASAEIVAGGAASLATGGGMPSPAIVTPATIASALSNSTMKTTQNAVSLPIIQRYVDMAKSGSAAPAIRVADGIIVEGNHRYIAGQITGRPPAAAPGAIAPSQVSRAKPIQEIKVDPKDWDKK